MKTFLFAGHDTTATTIAFAIYELSRHPEAEAKVVQEIRVGGGPDGATGLLVVWQAGLETAVWRACGQLGCASVCCAVGSTHAYVGSTHVYVGSTHAYVGSTHAYVGSTHAYLKRVLQAQPWRPAATESMMLCC